ncbi:MAG: hypothetical protein OSJ51_11830, partial [Parabacteroides distasonis]|nr:hypothetical protein [Parabacteroides distasonis]
FLILPLFKWAKSTNDIPHIETSNKGPAVSSSTSSFYRDNHQAIQITQRQDFLRWLSTPVKTPLNNEG